MMIAALCGAVMNVVFSGGTIQAEEHMFDDVITLWEMADLTESTGKGQDLSIKGDVKVGVKIKGDERDVSLQRGCDSLVAEFRGGWLELADASGMLPEVFSLAVRFRGSKEELAGTLISRKAPSAEESFDLAMFEATFLDLPILSFCQEDVSVTVFSKLHHKGRRDKGRLRVVNRHLDEVDLSVWHDVVIRCDGKTLELFWDGKLFDRRVVDRDTPPGLRSIVRSYQPLHDNAPERLCIGADPYGNNPFIGMIDRIAIWNRSLADGEIAALSGGRANVEWKGRKDAYTLLDKEGVRSDHSQAVAGMFPVEMTENERLVEIQNRMPEFLIDLIQSDPWFPRFHAALPGYIFNTHVLFHKDRWHLFPMWVGDHLGWFGRGRFFIAHLASCDLIQWEVLPFRLMHKELEGVGMCNLSFVSDGDRVHAFNLNNRHSGAPWYMYSDDPALAEWQFAKEQPVLLNDTEFTNRMDPAVFREGDWWYLTGSRTSKKVLSDELPLGSGDHLQGWENRRSWKNGFPLYRSQDLVNWEYRGCMFHQPWSECAQVIRLGERYLVAYGGSMGIEEAGGRPYHYLLGSFKDEQFLPATGGRWDHGSEARHISHTGIDSADRVINWFTTSLHSDEDARACMEIGWKGMHTLPREVYYRSDGTLAFKPAPELAALRRKHGSLDAREIEPGAPVTVPEVGGAQLEVAASFEKQGLNQQYGVAFFIGDEEYRVLYEKADQRIKLDLTKANKGPWHAHAAGKVFKTPVIEFKRNVDFRVFYDGSVIEVFAGGHTITATVGPTDPKAMRIKAFALGGSARLMQLDAWELGTIWEKYVD